MIIKILTHGQLDRFFIALFWLGGFSGHFWLDDPSKALAMSVITIVTANFILYFRASMRLVLLTNSSLRNVLPNYFPLLKRSLISLMLISLLPALTLLHQPMIMLSVMSLLLLLALVLVLVTYIPILYLGLLALLFAPMSFEQLFGQWGELLISVGAYTLPLIVVLNYLLISKIDKFNAKSKYVARMMQLSTGSSNMDLVSIEEADYQGQSAWRQWLSNSHFDCYREKLSKPESLSKQYLIETACQGLSSTHRYAFLIGGILAIVTVYVLDSFMPNSNGLKVALSLVSIALMVFGIITPFQIINKRKPLLKQLAALPIFSEQGSFAKAFIGQLLKGQLQLFASVLLVNLFIIELLWGASGEVMMNMALVCLFFITSSLTLMLCAWRASSNIEHPVIWAFIALFAVMSVTLMIALEHKLALYYSATFMLALMLSTALTIGGVYRSRHRIFY